MMNLTEELVSGVVRHCLGTNAIERFGATLDFTPPLPRIKFLDAVRDRSGLDLRTANEDDMRRVLRGAGGEPDAIKALSGGRLQDEVFKTFVEPHLVQPAFVV